MAKKKAVAKKNASRKKPAKKTPRKIASAKSKKALRNKKTPAKKKTSRRQKEFSAADVAEAIDNHRINNGKNSEFADALAGSNSKAVEKLLKSGRSVHEKVIGQFTPLIIATACGNDSIVKLILKHGADPTQHPILMLCSDETAKTKLLLKAGANPNAKFGTKTALMNAIEWRERRTIELLINAGAKTGKAEIALARKINDPKINKLLGLKVEEKLSLPMMLPKPFKEGVRAAFEVCGCKPLLTLQYGLDVYTCQVDPDLFLDEDESTRFNAAGRAISLAAKQLRETVSDCEFAESNVVGDVVLILQSKNKFYFQAKPKKLREWLEDFDGSQPVEMLSLFDERTTFRIKKKLTAAQIKRWKKSWSQAGVDEAKIELSAEKLVVSFET